MRTVESVSREFMRGLCESFGFEPHQVIAIRLTPKMVEVDVLERLAPGAFKRTHRLPVVEGVEQRPAS